MRYALIALVLAGCSAPLAPCECTDVDEHPQPEARELVKNAAGYRQAQLTAAGMACTPLTNVIPSAGPEDVARVDCCLPAIFLAETCDEVLDAAAACDAYVVQR